MVPRNVPCAYELHAANFNCGAPPQRLQVRRGREGHSLRNSSIMAVTNERILVFVFVEEISPMYSPCPPGKIASFACGSARESSSACSFPSVSPLMTNAGD